MNDYNIDLRLFILGVLKEAQFYGLDRLSSLLETNCPDGDEALNRNDILKLRSKSHIAGKVVAYNLCGANLKGADLSNLDLSQTNLKVSLSHIIRYYVYRVLSLLTIDYK